MKRINIQDKISLILAEQFQEIGLSVGLAFAIAKKVAVPICKIISNNYRRRKKA